MDFSPARSHLPGKRAVCHPCQIVPHQVKMLNLGWKKALCSQVRCVAAFSTEILRDAYPSAAACGRVSQDTWSQSNRTQFTAHGSRVEGAKETVHCPSELLVHSQQQERNKGKKLHQGGGTKIILGNR